jgi:hypothetical protein
VTVANTTFGVVADEWQRLEPVIRKTGDAVRAAKYQPTDAVPPLARRLRLPAQGDRDDMQVPS